MMKLKILSASTLSGNEVKNHLGENIGHIKDLMINLHDGSVAYAVMSFGGFLGVGEKLFAIPWSRIQVDQRNKCCVVDMSKEYLEKAPGFDKDNWPKSDSTVYLEKVYDYHDSIPFWS
jgi:sporulation protein YlmC with PRC-barrel domain